MHTYTQKQTAKSKSLILRKQRKRALSKSIAQEPDIRNPQWLDLKTKLKDKELLIRSIGIGTNYLILALRDLPKGLGGENNG